MQQVTSYKKKVDTLKSIIITNNDNYIVFDNENIIDIKADNKIKTEGNKLYFLKSGVYKIIYTNNAKVNINLEYVINDNIEIDLYEMYIDIVKEYEANRKVLYGKGAIVNHVSFLTSKTNANIRLNSYTEVKDNAYIKNKNLYIASCLLNCLNDVYIKDTLINYDMENTVINASGLDQTYNFYITHEKGHSTSEMINYGISKNNSKIVIDSKGVIKKDAVKTDLKQKSKGLILDLNSVISASPILEIDEFDVVASHGSSIGAISEDDLYYMQSRGLPKDVAQNIIVQGLIHPYIDFIVKGKLQDYIIKKIEKHL